MESMQSFSTTQVHPTAKIINSKLGEWTEVAARAQLVECCLDDYSYVMNDSDLMYTQLGKFCSVASHVRINPSNHPMWRASQHHFTYRCSTYGMGNDDTAFFDWRRKDNITIGHDVWIGHGAVILPGRKIGTGAVIGAGTVVTKDVEPYSIVVGTPARHLRYRFSKEIRNALLQLAWWDWDHAKIKQTLPDFQHLSIEEFIVKHQYITPNYNNK